MTRVKRPAGMTLAPILASIALAALGAPPASAQQQPALRLCKQVPAGAKGLWNNNQCSGTNVVAGAWAWSWPELNLTAYCILEGTAFTESLCKTGGAGPFRAKRTSEPFPRIGGKLLLSVLTSKVAGIEVGVHCEVGNLEGQPASEALLGLIRLTYTSCSVRKPVGCEVGNPSGAGGTIKTELLDGLLLSLTLVDLRPEATTDVTELEFKGGSCSLSKIDVALTGQQMCGFEAGISSPALSHLLTCKAAESELKLGTSAATYEGTAHVAIESNLYWDIQ